MAKIKIDKNLITFEFLDQKDTKLKIFFDKNSLELKGWKTKDSYMNVVNFTIYNLKINNDINLIQVETAEEMYNKSLNICKEYKNIKTDHTTGYSKYFKR